VRTLLIFLITIALGAASYFYWNGSHKAVFEVASVTRGPAVEAIYATAVVEPVRWSAIAPLKTGQIDNILVEEGDAVQKGQLLAHMDDEDLKAQLEETKALIVYSQKAYNRGKALFNSKSAAISEEELDKRRRNLNQQKSHARMFEEQIRQLSLKSPQDGVVLWRDIDPGEIKQAGETVFWVGQPKPLRLNAEGDEEDIPKIKPGQDVLILADAFPNEVMQGRVAKITPKGDPVNKSYRVYMSLPDETKLLIGMTVETNTVVKKTENALLVPSSALLDGMVFRVTQNNKIQRTDVKLGTIGEDHVQILEGLSASDRLLLNPTPTLKDGQKIRAE
jgi:HlyD family secretion protein